MDGAWGADRARCGIALHVRAVAVKSIAKRVRKETPCTRSGAEASAERASHNSSDQAERHQPAQGANQQVGLVVPFIGRVVGGCSYSHEMRAP